MAHEKFLDASASAMHILARHEGRGLWLGDDNPPVLPPDGRGFRIIDADTYRVVVESALWANGHN